MKNCSAIFAKAIKPPADADVLKVFKAWNILIRG